MWTYDEVAHHIRIPRIYEQAHAILDKVGQEGRAVVRTVALERERLVHLHVAAFKIARRVDAECALHRGLVHPRLDPAHLLVAEVAVALAVALLTHIVRVVPELCEAEVNEEVQCTVMERGTHG